MSEPAIASQDVNRAQRRSGRTHKRLLDSALILFNEKGIDAASVEMITDKADLGKGTFYRHFDDKYDIVHALLNQVLAQLLERIAKKTGTSTSWESAAGHVIEEHAAFFIENPNYHGFILQTRIIGHIREALDQKNNPPIATYLTVLEKIFKPLLPDTTSPLHLRRLVCALSGSVMGFLTLAGIGLRREDVVASLPVLREGFLKGASAWVNSNPVA